MNISTMQYNADNFLNNIAEVNSRVLRSML